MDLGPGRGREPSLNERDRAASPDGLTIRPLTAADRAALATWARETTRCFATFSDDGRTQRAHHQLCEDGVTWQPTMDIALHKIV